MMNLKKIHHTHIHKQTNKKKKTELNKKKINH